MRSPVDKVQWTDLDKESRVFADKRIDAGFWGTNFNVDQTHAFYHLNQTHSTKIVALDDSYIDEVRPEGDGIYTREPDKIIAVKTADCLPVLLADPEDRIVMAVHAGWRGLAGGIVANALSKFAELGANMEKLQVCLGPCISSPAFEVGREVIDAFESSPYTLPDDEFFRCFSKGKEDRWHFDLALYAVQQCIARAVLPQNIRVFRHCTFQEATRWSSYRREKQTSRNWSWITFKS